MTISVAGIPITITRGTTTSFTSSLAYDAKGKVTSTTDPASATYYPEFEDLIWIVALAHQRRRPGYWLRRMLS